MLKKERRTSTGKVRVEVEQLSGISLSTQTIQNRAHEIGLLVSVAEKKPYVNNVSRVQHLKYATGMLLKPIDFWETVIWSDGSKFTEGEIKPPLSVRISLIMSESLSADGERNSTKMNASLKKKSNAGEYNEERWLTPENHTCSS